MNRHEEMAIKLDRLRRLINGENLSGVLLRSRGNFAWLTGGGLSYINAASEAGVGAMLVTADRVALLANNIEAQRFVDEELTGLNVDVIDFPWHAAGAEAAALGKVVDAGRLGVDLGEGRPMEQAIRRLRNPLTEAEVARYREHGRLTTELTERVCREISKGMTEDDVAALVYQHFAAHNVRVPVCLVAADDRINTRRHPIYKSQPIHRRVMVVVCGESGGLWTNLTRLVNFEPPDAELKIKHRACCQVDVTANHATRPGRTLAEIFSDIVAEYDRQGFADEWRLHHQGGSTGYAGRDDFGTPNCDARVIDGQAFAWNPSITGTKCEDTMLVREGKIEWLTAPGREWPTVEIERDGVVYRRADILLAD